MRLQTVIVWSVFLLHGCAWTYIHAVPEEVPATPAERSERIALCTENMDSAAVVGDIIASSTQVPLLAGSTVIMAMDWGHVGTFKALGAGVAIVSATTLILHSLSWYYGAKHRNRCETFLRDVSMQEPVVPTSE